MSAGRDTSGPDPVATRTDSGATGRGPHGPVALVLAGGVVPLGHLRESLVEGVTMVVAADGGLELAASLGVAPDLLVGDMDSVTPETLSRYPNVAIERHPRRKDELDLEIAIDVAVARGVRSIRVAGAFGDRLDQSLAALLVAAKHARAGMAISLHAGADEVRLVAAGSTHEATAPTGATLSLLALAADAEVTFTGVEYPLERASLPFGSGLGVSNVATSPVQSLSVHRGVVALLLRRQEPPQLAP